MSPEVHVWVCEEGMPDGTPLLGLSIPHACILEQDGELITGLCLSPDGARELAAALLVKAEQAEEEE